MVRVLGRRCILSELLSELDDDTGPPWALTARRSWVRCCTTLRSGTTFHMSFFFSVQQVQTQCSPDKSCTPHFFFFKIQCLIHSCLQNKNLKSFLGFPLIAKLKRPEKYDILGNLFMDLRCSLRGCERWINTCWKITASLNMVAY